MTRQTEERQITSLLRDAAEAVSQEVDLRPRLNQRLATVQPLHQSGQLKQSSARSPIRWRRPMIGIAIAVLFSLTAFTFARPLIFSWLGDSGLQGVALHNATRIDQTVSVHGISLQLEQAYADAARTALTMRISSSGTSDQYTPNDVSLIDAHGAVYRRIGGAQVNEESLFEFVPLPLDQLDSIQSLTLVVPSMHSLDVANASVAGPWQITFNVQPNASRSITLSPSPVTHAGIAIQPERLDLAPTGSRLLVRISGLSADTSLFAVAHFATSGPDIMGCLPGSGTCVSSASSGDGALVELMGPDGQLLAPAWVGVEGLSAPGVGSVPTASQAVGPSGSVVLEFLFFAPLHAMHGTAQAVIEQVDIAEVNSGPGSSGQAMSGPWTFDFTLS